MLFNIKIVKEDFLAEESWQYNQTLESYDSRMNQIVDWFSEIEFSKSVLILRVLWSLGFRKFENDRELL